MKEFLGLTIEYTTSDNKIVKIDINENNISLPQNITSLKTIIRRKNYEDTVEIYTNTYYIGKEIDLDTLPIPLLKKEVQEKVKKLKEIGCKIAYLDSNNILHGLNLNSRAFRSTKELATFLMYINQCYFKDYQEKVSER